MERIICGDARVEIPRLEEIVDMVMTSPPYWGLRDYGIEPQIWDGDENCEHDWFTIRGLREATPGDKPSPKSVIAIHRTNAENRPGKPSDFCHKCGAWKGCLGLEPSPELYIKHLADVFDLIKPKLRKMGSVYVNLGDTYWSAKGSCFNPGGGKHSLEKDKKIQGAYPLHRGNVSDFPNLKPKNLILIPSRFAIEMQTRGWILRNDIIWHKPNPMPSSVKDRLNTTYEHVFHFVKSRKYYYDLDAIREKHKEQDKRGHNRIAYAGKSNPPERNFSEGADFLGQYPLGKNPGDVLSVPSREVKDKEYKSRDPERHVRVDGMKNPGDFWQITTQPFPDLHFATFPEVLCERPIKSSCPAQICQTCRKPRERITQSTFHKICDALPSKIGDSQRNPDERTDLPANRGYTTHETLGFTDCGHNNYKLGVVLDPFAGAGTTGVVARQLGRSFILIDIKQGYCDMARKRLAQVERPLTVYEGPPPEPDQNGRRNGR